MIIINTYLRVEILNDVSVLFVCDCKDTKKSVVNDYNRLFYDDSFFSDALSVEH